MKLGLVYYVHNMYVCFFKLLFSVKTDPALGLPFWYRVTWVVSDKGPLNGCCCCCISNIQKPAAQFAHTVQKGKCYFRPYGRKSSLKFRYFPSVRTEI